MYSVAEIISIIFIVAGAFFLLTSSMGLLRMPDFYSRLHPAGLADSLGAPLLLTGLAIFEGISLTSGKLFALMAFLVITNPTATHVLAKAARLQGVRAWQKKDDDL